MSVKIFTGNVNVATPVFKCVPSCSTNRDLTSGTFYHCGFGVWGKRYDCIAFQTFL